MIFLLLIPASGGYGYGIRFHSIPRSRVWAAIVQVCGPEFRSRSIPCGVPGIVMTIVSDWFADEVACPAAKLPATTSISATTKPTRVRMLESLHRFRISYLLPASIEPRWKVGPVHASDSVYMVLLSSQRARTGTASFGESARSSDGSTVSLTNSRHR